MENSFFIDDDLLDITFRKIQYRMQAKKSWDKQFATAKCLLIYQWYQRRHILSSACLKVPIQVTATCRERSPEIYLCMVKSKWYELYLDDYIFIHHIFFKNKYFISTFSMKQDLKICNTILMISIIHKNN